MADKSYTGAGIGIHTPIKGAKPCPDDTAYNTIQAGLYAPDERANALLKSFKALRKVSLNPSTITTITSTALVILNLNNQPQRERLTKWAFARNSCHYETVNQCVQYMLERVSLLLRIPSYIMNSKFTNAFKITSL